MRKKKVLFEQPKNLISHLTAAMLVFVLLVGSFIWINYCISTGKPFLYFPEILYWGLTHALGGILYGLWEYYYLSKRYSQSK